HNYNTWATAPYTTPVMNPPRITGPTTIMVCLDDLMGPSMIHSATGNAYDVLSSLNIENVEFGRDATKEVKDTEAEGMGFAAPVNVQSFQVQLRDGNAGFRLLTLPRNQTVHVVLQLLYSDR